MSRVGQHVLYDVRTTMFNHLQKLSLSFYNRYSVGRVITRVINDVGTLREFITWRCSPSSATCWRSSDPYRHVVAHLRSHFLHLQFCLS